VIIDQISREKSLTVVGDDNQSIYSFKFAHPEGIREFSDSHNPCEDYELVECRRCPTQVVQIANSLIKHDSHHREEKNEILRPYSPNGTGLINLVQWGWIDEEVIGISDFVKSELNRNEGILKPEDVLILNPSKKIAKMINQRLNSIGVPSQFVSKAIDLILDDETSRNIYAFLSFISDESDYVSFRYLLHRDNNWYSRTYMKIVNHANQQGMNPLEVFKGIINDEIKIPRITAQTPIVERYSQLMQMVTKAQEIKDYDDFILFLSTSFPEGAQNLIDEVNITQQDFEYNSDIASPFVIQLSRFLVSNIVNKISSADDVILDDKVRVMTCHSAKGLKGKLVIISSCVDGLLPRTKDNPDIDEQRRLFYVAITRCEYTKNGYPGRLIISSFTRISEPRKKNLGIVVPYRGVQSSRFLMEIDSSLLPESTHGNSLR
jgi:superfamily I DNA/RNA helicase